MKKNAFFLAAVCFMLTLGTQQLSAANTLPENLATSLAAAKEDPSPRVASIAQRIEEIQAMDKSKLTRQERKALRREMREAKQELQAVGGGIYIGAGALIVILILLIILL